MPGVSNAAAFDVVSREVWPVSTGDSYCSKRMRLSGRRDATVDRGEGERAAAAAQQLPTDSRRSCHYRLPAADSRQETLETIASCSERKIGWHDQTLE